MKAKIGKCIVGIYMGFVVIVVMVALYWFIHDANATRAYNIDTYHEAVELFNEQEYHDALLAFWTIKNCGDSMFEGPSPKYYIAQCQEILGDSVSYCAHCGWPE